MDAATPENLSQTVTALTQIGFTAWLAWYLTTTAIPRQQQRHDAQLTSLTTTHAATIKDQRNDFAAVLAEEREARANDTNRIIEALHHLHSAISKNGQPHK